MVPAPSWLSRCALALLVLQLASACDPNPSPPPPPPPGSDTTPPSTRADPAGGGFGASVTVTLTCEDGAGGGCAATYYTADGSTPTSGSTRYTTPVALARSTSLKFFSVDKAGNAEAVRMERYTFDSTPPTVAASPAGGTYNTAQTVTLSCADGTGTGCGPIHYTTDGTAPSASSPVYTVPLLVSTSTTLRFVALDGAGNSSQVVSGVYVIDEAGPDTTASQASGIYSTTFPVTLTCEDGTGSGCAATYYTLDGSPPTTGSARYNAPLFITSSTTLKFFSLDRTGNAGPTGTARYTLDFTAPVTLASPAGGTYQGAQTVRLLCDDGGGSGCAATYFTLDGSTPNRNSPRYTVPVSITANTTLRFFSVDKANLAESVRTEEYDLDSVPPTTTATPAGGLYKSHQNVVLGCDDGLGSGCAGTHYTLDGSAPSTGSPKYTAPLLLTGNTTLKFLSVDGAGNVEPARSATYVIDTTAPTTTATPPAGTYGDPQSVTLLCDDGSGSGCAETRYTLDGSAPSSGSPLYTGPLTLSSTTTLRYVSTDKAGNRESTRVALYSLDRVAPTVSASPGGGLYATSRDVTLTCTDDTGGSGCTSIHFTTDGTAPTPASTRYTAPLGLSATTTLKFLAVDKVGNESGVQTEQYQFDLKAPTTTATPAGGTYASTQLVTLRCDDGAGSGCAATHYTVDGSTPTPSSPLYSAPLSLGASATLKFFSVDRAGHLEPVRSQTYLIDTVRPMVAANPTGGTYGTEQRVTLACTDNADGSGCASLHFTTDGSAPTTGSPTYTVPFTVSANTRLQFLAVDKVGNVSTPRMEEYVIDTVAPSTRVSPAGGTYVSAQTVTLTCTDTAEGSGCAATYYTTNGSTPTTASQKYTGPFSLSTSGPLKFFSVDAAGNAEPVRTEAYTFELDTVAPVTTASPAGGTYGGPQSVTLTCDDGAGSGCFETYYTLDGTPPSPSSSLYTFPLTLSSTTTLRYLSKDKAGNLEPGRVATYIFDQAAPTASASPRGGLYRTAPTVTLTCTDEVGGSGCASLHYTLDGSTPTAASATYTAPLTLSATTPLKFLAVDKVGHVSSVSTEHYTLDPVPAVTTVTPLGGAYGTGWEATLVCDDGGGSGCVATHYTVDGSTPTRASPLYSAPFLIMSNTTLKFFSVDAAGNDEPVRTETYIIDRVAPLVAASPAGGTYNSARTVTLTCTDTPDGSGCASIHYTLDGRAPTPFSATYTEPLHLSADTTLRFLAMDKVGNFERPLTEVYVFDTVAPNSWASPPGGTYTGPVSLYLNCSDNLGCAATHYTVDGSEPTTASPLYDGSSLHFTADTTLKFFSVDLAGNAAPVRTETYVIRPDTSPPYTYVYPTGGTYASAQYVNLSCADDTGCAGTYYTLDGSTPTASSPRYFDYIPIFANTTLRFFSVDMAGNTEPVRTEVYVIGAPPSDASARIAYIRSLPDGPLSESLEGALVTYTKAATGTGDPAGFFLQAEQNGPALFVAVDPATLFPVPKVGDRVSLVATSKATVTNGLVRLTQLQPGSFTLTSTGESVEFLRQDVSTTDLVTSLNDYEQELISVSGTVTSTFSSAGNGHVSASFVTVGTPSPNTNLKLRLTTSVQDTLEVAQGCSLTVTSPLWRFGNQAQPSAWKLNDVFGLSCPGPKVVNAIATNNTGLVVYFDRRINPVSVNSNGSQFTFSNGLVARSATVVDRQLLLTTSSQVAGASYQVTVAPGLQDTLGTVLDASANTAAFTGYSSGTGSGPAQLLLNEVNPNMSGDKDLIELLVVKGGSVDQMTLVVENNTPTVLATLPEVTVATGDIIVVHLNPSATDFSETASKAQHVSPYNYDTAWDFVGYAGNLAYSHRVLRLKDAQGKTQDAVAFAHPAITTTQPGGYPSSLRTLQGEGLWLPTSCGGMPCDYLSTPSATAPEVSVSWSGVSNTSATSVQRRSGVDTNQASDWYPMGPSSFGFPNP